MQNNGDYWREQYDYIDWKYQLLLKNWKASLVKEVDRERQILERDKVIVALQDRIKKYESRVPQL